jgi:hypothetical protein
MASVKSDCPTLVMHWGSKVMCVKDENTYEIGIKVKDDDFEKINIKKETICPEWNYIISPNK